MRNRGASRLFASILSVLLASPLFSTLSADETAATLGRIVSSPPATLNGLEVPAEATLLDGDRLATGEQGWARVLLPEGEQIHLGARSQARAQRRGNRLEIELSEGWLALRTGNDRVLVRSNGLEIVPGDATTVWEVVRLDEDQIVVAAYRGTLEVRGANRTVEVPAGRSARVESRLAEDDDQEKKPVGAQAGAGLSTTQKVLIVAAVFGGVTAVVLPLTIGRNAEEVVSPSVP
ncbi:MAG: FecR domain-containing protein [Terriglobia bacterium]